MQQARKKQFARTFGIAGSPEANRIPDEIQVGGKAGQKPDIVVTGQMSSDRNHQKRMDKRNLSIKGGIYN